MAGSGSTGDPDDEAFRHPEPDPQQGQPARAAGSPRRRRRCPRRRATRCSAPCSRTACSKNAPRRASTPASPGARTPTAPGSRSASPTPACAPSALSRTRAPRRHGPGPTAPTAAPERSPTRTPGREAAQDAAAPDEAARAGPRARPPLAAPVPPGGKNLRQAAQAVLDTWDDDADRGALAGPMERLRAVLAKPTRAARDPGAPRKPREGTKREKVLAMLRRPEGATVAQIARPPAGRRTRCGASSPGSRRRASTVAVLERVRQVGPNKDGRQGLLQHLPHGGRGMAADARRRRLLMAAGVPAA